MDLQYSDDEVSYLLGGWLAALAFFLVSTTRPSYSPYLHPVGDRLLFFGLLALVFVGVFAADRHRDLALGAPTTVCGVLVSWSVFRTLLFEVPSPTVGVVLAAAGFCLIGCLCAREGVVIARGDRREPADRRNAHTNGPRTRGRESRSRPRTRWRWWAAAALLVGTGFLLPL